MSSADGGDKAVSPMLLNNYARTLAELHRFDEAGRYAELAYERARIAGDETVVNQSLLTRAIVYRKQGHLDRAGRMLVELAPRFQRMLPPGNVAFAALASQEGLLAEARGDLGTAMRHTERAIAMVEAVGGSVSYLPSCYNGGPISSERCTVWTTPSAMRRRLSNCRSSSPSPARHRATSG